MILVESKLSIDSCLCDFCWKHLEKIYKANRAEQRKDDISDFKTKTKKFLERWKKTKRPQTQARICSAHNCSKTYVHKLTVVESKNIKQLLLTFETCSVSIY